MILWDFKLVNNIAEYISYVQLQCKYTKFSYRTSTFRMDSSILKFEIVLPHQSEYSLKYLGGSGDTLRLPCII